MKITVFSDLHVDLNGVQSVLDDVDNNDCDVVVLAGDIAEIRKNEHVTFLRLFCAKVRVPVVMVMGNHEYWHTTADHVSETLEQYKSIKNLYVLNRNVVTIQGQRFVGATMWFAKSPFTELRAKKWNEFRIIENGHRWIWEESARDCEFLWNNIQPGDVVITHHAPTWRSLQPVRHEFDVYYTNESWKWWEKDAQLWIHGHTHRHCQYTMGNTRVICNPYGYYKYGERTGFDPQLQIELNPESTTTTGVESTKND